MKPTKKIILEVTQEAINRDFSPSLAIDILRCVSIAMYKSMKAKGVVTAAIQTNEDMIAFSEGGISFNNCTVQQVTEKAFLLTSNSFFGEKWVAKSIIENDVIPHWATK